MLTALNFDNAVMTFGVWADNMLAERDADGNRAHDLRELLDMPFTAQELRAKTLQSLALLDIMSRKPGSGIKAD